MLSRLSSMSLKLPPLLPSTVISSVRCVPLPGWDVLLLRSACWSATLCSRGIFFFTFRARPASCNIKKPLNVKFPSVKSSQVSKVPLESTFWTFKNKSSLERLDQSHLYPILSYPIISRVGSEHSIASYLYSYPAIRNFYIWAREWRDSRYKSMCIGS